MKLKKYTKTFLPVVVMGFLVQPQQVCKSIYEGALGNEQDTVYRIDRNSLEERDRIFREMNKRFLDDMEKAIENQRRMDGLPALTRTLGTGNRITISDDDRDD
jgi:hypothetical protein